MLKKTFRRPCRAVLRIVLERVLGGSSAVPEGEVTDMMMFVGPGGLERHRNELAPLFASGGPNLRGFCPRKDARSSSQRLLRLIR
jgi:hypothetical protein